MKVAVAVKQVGSLAGARPAINEWDLFALEAALELRDEHGAEVVAITVGDQEADEALRTSLANGADRGVRAWDDQIESDPLTVARLLAEVLRRESPNLIFCGAQSSDAVNASTGTALAGLLDLPRVAVIKRFRYDADTGSIEADRELESGLVERVSVSTPALLTLQTGVNQPRHANLRAIKQAEAQPLEVLGLGDLGLRAEELERTAGAHVRRFAPPDRSGRAEMLEGGPDEVAQKILAIVSSRLSP